MLKPIQDWIVTKVVEINDSNTIIQLLKDNNSTKYVELLSFGPEANVAGLLKSGDIVLVPSKSGIKTRQDGIEYELAKEKNFLGIYERSE